MIKLTANLLTILLVLIYTGCLFDNSSQAGGGSETGNVGGTIIASDGLAKANVDVHLFLAKQSIDSLQASPEPVLITKTDINGNYSFNVLEQNTYNIIAQSETEIAFVDSLSISPDSKLSQNISLNAPGSIQAQIQLRIELKHPSSVVAYLAGTSYYQNLSDSGSFIFENVPEGTYTLVLIPNQEMFSNTILQISVVSGVPTIIANPIQLQYNGIPIPNNVLSIYDTTTGAVTISWDSINYDHFQEYLIERNTGDNLVANWQLVGKTQATTFTELMYLRNDVSKINPEDTAQKSFDYRVKVRSNYNDEEGLSYGKSTINIVSPRKFQPYASVEQKSLLIETTPFVSLKGTGYSELGTVTMEWDIGNTGVFESTPDGNISFLYYEKNISNPHICIFRVTDTNGTTALDTSTVTINHQAFLPIADAGNMQTVDRGSRVALKGTGSSKIGVNTYEWKVGEGDWVFSEDGAFEFQYGTSVFMDSIICYLRVTNRDFQNAIDSVTIRFISKFEDIKAPLPFTYDSTIHPIGFKNNIWFFSKSDSTTISSWILNSDNLYTYQNNIINNFQSEKYWLMSDSLSLYLIDYSRQTNKLTMRSSTDGLSWTSIDYPIVDIDSNTYINSIVINKGYIYAVVNDNSDLNVLVKTIRINVSSKEISSLPELSAEGISWDLHEKNPFAIIYNDNFCLTTSDIPGLQAWTCLLDDTWKSPFYIGTALGSTIWTYSNSYIYHRTPELSNMYWQLSVNYENDLSVESASLNINPWPTGIETQLFLYFNNALYLIIDNNVHKLDV
ncbi:MAG: hypothetical protein OCD01_09460 [Fibrobacterales bacterium]